MAMHRPDGSVVPEDTFQRSEESATKHPCFAAEDGVSSRRAMRLAYLRVPDLYKTWLNEDVVYTISPEERCEFLHLDSTEERERFIEHFWLLRSSNLDVPDNDFEVEYYGRIVFANQHYSTDVPGWKTDRGHVYIQNGRPDEIERHTPDGFNWTPYSFEREGPWPEGTNPEAISTLQEISIPLRPGYYEMAIAVKDVTSKKVGVVHSVLCVPTYNQLAPATPIQ